MAGLYFPHDYTAAKDSKIIALRMAFGWEGYGVFWALIEMLASDSSHTLPTDYNSLAWELRFDAGKLKKLICDYGLFTLTEDGSGFYSERMSQQLQDIDDVREKRRQAANKRWRKTKKEGSESNSDANALQMQTKSDANKINKIKENINSITNDKSLDNTISPRDFSEPEKVEKPAIETDLFGKVVAVKQVKPRNEPLSEFKIILNNGEFYEVTIPELNNWERLYPAVDVRQQLRNMQGWADANPQKRKTKTGIRRFINTWLANQQNASGTAVNYVHKPLQPLPMSKQQCKPPTIDDCPF